MTRFVIKEYLFQPPLLLWPAISIFLAFLILISPVENLTNNSYSFEILGSHMYMNNNIFIWNGGEIILNVIYGIVVLQCIVVFPKPFLDMLASNRIGLILSKPISRNKFIYSNILGVFICLVIYSIATISLINISIFIRTFSFASNLITPFLFMPFYLISIYILSLLIILFTNSYVTTTFSLLVYSSISSVLYYRGSFFGNFFAEQPIYDYLLSYIYYLTPRLQDFSEFSKKLYFIFQKIKRCLSCFCVLLRTRRPL